MATKRIELKQCEVEFYPDDHTYFLGDKQLSGITGVIDRQLFPDTYTDVPEAILKKASLYGSDVHSSLEKFDAYWINDGSKEVADYIRICKENNLIHEASEYLITDGDSYASMIDKVFRTCDDHFILCDIKTYGVMDNEKLEKVRWQLSLYSFMFSLQNPKAKIDRLIVIHLRNKLKSDGSYDNIANLIEVQRIPSEICKELLEADKAGEKFQNPYAIPEDIRQQESEIRKLIQAKQDAETRLNSIKARILSMMEAQDIKSWATDTMRITRKLPSTRNSFSLADFKEANPTMDIEPYMRTSQVAGSLTITI